jgi:type IV secretion system protein TrbL
MRPSVVMDAGAVALTPITDFIARTKGWEALKNIGVLFQYSLVYDFVLFAFIGIALNISLTVIEFHFAVLLATVLVPWAPLGATAFLAEFSLGWVAGMVVRLLAQTALIGISIPLFDRLVLTLTPGGDPDFWGALGVLGGAALFFILSWLLPNRSARLLAGGLAIAGNDVVAGATAAARGFRGFAAAGGAAVSGVSSLIRQERRA